MCRNGGGTDTERCETINSLILTTCSYILSTKKRRFFEHQWSCCAMHDLSSHSWTITTTETQCNRHHMWKSSVSSKFGCECDHYRTKNSRYSSTDYGKHNWWSERPVYNYMDTICISESNQSINCMPVLAWFLLTNFRLDARLTMWSL